MAMEFNAANFETEVLKSEVPVLVDFWAAWCGPCRAIAPIIDQLSAEFAGKVKIGKVNVDENRDLAQQFGVMSIPTLIFFKGGQKVDQVIGFTSKADLEKKLNALL
ncbi:thioredoxin [Desulforamulus hydrothermalis]|uniref:Thioredoxin n=1 Tax=Desulforamulus hydrothermalis Lam5 = DSM 18033 TaxID=1121428 RepID=K8EB01_9FIRM|nr:thioredoxin [Desulforamulus hydrothermalis]CCO08823.1 Thioredoxin-1 [Desulforamulus hydrothermalis Lam5 = DSM 18033]SHG72459.1 thioredoxin [Desulforamulus hydrothermalis Lam5 = DSM 18033]